MIQLEYDLYLKVSSFIKDIWLNIIGDSLTPMAALHIRRVVALNEIYDKVINYRIHFLTG